MVTDGHRRIELKLVDGSLALVEFFGDDSEDRWEEFRDGKDASIDARVHDPNEGNIDVVVSRAAVVYWRRLD